MRKRGILSNVALTSVSNPTNFVSLHARHYNSARSNKNSIVLVENNEVPLVRTQDFSHVSLLKTKGSLSAFSPTVHVKGSSRCVTSGSKRGSRNIGSKFDAKVQEMFKRRFSGAHKENIKEQKEAVPKETKVRKLTLLKEKHTERAKASTRCTERVQKVLKVQQDAHNDTLLKLRGKVRFNVTRVVR